MADDRIYLKCNICGETLFLGKQYAYGPFFWLNYGKLGGDISSPSLEERLNDFYDEHVHPDSDDKKWNGNYSIEYESDIWGSDIKEEEK